MILQLLIAWLATRIHHHQDQVIHYLREENRILKATCKGKRMPLTELGFSPSQASPLER